MVRWHHQFNRYEFEQTPGDSEGQGSMACSNPWSHRAGYDLVTEQQEAIVRTRHGTADWFQMGKGVCQCCILSPCLFNLFAEYIM